MERKPPADEIRSVARAARPDRPSSHNCDAINTQIAHALRDRLGLPAERVEGAVVDDAGRTAGHVFVGLPGSCVRDLSGSVIVDGALRQFHDEASWKVTLGDQDDLPRVAVFGRRSPLHECYTARPHEHR